MTAVTLLYLVVLLAGVAIGVLLTCTFLLWTRGARGLIRDRLGITSAMTDLNNLLQNNGLAVKAGFDEDGEQIKLLWAILEQVTTQLNSNTVVLRDIDELHKGYAHLKPEFRKLMFKQEQRRKMHIGTPPGTTAKAMPGPDAPVEVSDRCATCNHPQMSHQIDGVEGACRVPSCGCPKFYTRDEEMASGQA